MKLLGLLGLGLMWIAAPARAQFIVGWPIGTTPPIVGPGTFPPPGTRTDLTALVLAKKELKGSIQSQVARLNMEAVFRNDTDRRLEGELLIPIPADAVLDKLELKIGDRVQKAELLDADRARATYEAIVRQAKDPALLELAGERLARARVFPIEPHSQLSLRFSYTQILPKQGGLYALRLPLGHSAGRAAEVHLDLESPSRINLLYSPTEAVSIKRDGERRAAVDYAGAAEGKDLMLLYSLDEGKLGSSVATFRRDGEDGWFLLSLAPELGADAPAQPKDVVFVLDRSGSMDEDGKMEQARKALLYCLSKLPPQDRFAVVDFATEVSDFEPGLRPATAALKRKAQDYVKRLDTSGGTNLEGALSRALELLGTAHGGRVPMLVLLTDGLPTVGNKDTDSLLAYIHDRNRAVKARFFCLGAGTDVNSLFLDKLAEGQRGSRDYILPGEDIELKMGALYDRISKPALSDLKLDWSGVEVAQVYPKSLPDLYHGEPAVLLGRVVKGGRAKLTLSGISGGARKDYVLDLDFASPSAAHDYLPRLWAQRKVASLMDDLRLGGRNPEVVAEISRLAKRYGIVTPYTSFLIADDKDVAALGPRAEASMDAMRRDAAATGAGAARGHAFSRMMEAAKSAAAPAVQSMISGAGGNLGAALYADEERDALSRLELRRVGERTFYRRKGAWVDGAYEAKSADMKETRIKFLSQDYFDLLGRHPELKDALALGKEVVVVLEGRAYRITAE